MIKNDRGDRILAYPEISAIFNPLFHVSLSNDKRAYIYRDSEDGETIVTSGNDKRFESIVVARFFEVSSSDLENRLSDYDYVSIRCLKDTENTTELVIPDNVLQIKKLVDFNSLTELTYSNAIIEPIPTSECPMLSVIHESDNLRSEKESGFGINSELDYALLGIS